MKGRPVYWRDKVKERALRRDPAPSRKYADEQIMAKRRALAARLRAAAERRSGHD